MSFCFFFQAEDGIRDGHVTGVQTCALPIFFLKEYQRLRPYREKSQVNFLLTCSLISCLSFFGSELSAFFSVFNNRFAARWDSGSISLTVPWAITSSNIWETDIRSEERRVGA